MQDWMIVTGITVAYLVFILVVGLRARNEEASTLEGYVAGGRNIGLVFLFFILGAEAFSAFSFLGGPGEAYSSGVPVMYIMAYLTMGIGMMWMIGPRVARLGRRFGYLTQADLASDRFSSKGLGVLIALVGVVALVPYMTVQITGMGLLFQAATDGNVPFWLGSLGAFLVVTIYVYSSGLRGIGWTNLVQGILMVAVAWFLGISIANRLYGGVGQMFTEIQTRAPEYLTVPGGGEGRSWTAFSTAILISILGITMWPHLFMRFYATDSEKEFKKVLILQPLYAFILIPLFIIGFAGILVFSDDPLSNPDNVLLELVVGVANFSPWILGIMLSGALAAAMSTASNLSHAASTVLVRDLFGAVKPDMTDQRVVSLTKIFVVVLSVIAYVLALFNPASLVQLLLSAYGLIAQPLPVILAALFWKRATTLGAVSGLLSGSVVSTVFTLFVTSPLEVDPGIWGIIVNTIVLVGVSLATKPLPRAHVERFIATSETAPAEEADEQDVTQKA